MDDRVFIGYYIIYYVENIVYSIRIYMYDIVYFLSAAAAQKKNTKIYHQHTRTLGFFFLGKTSTCLWRLYGDFFVFLHIFFFEYSKTESRIALWSPDVRSSRGDLTRVSFSSLMSARSVGSTSSIDSDQ